jgi:hypothetical protein
MRQALWTRMSSVLFLVVLGAEPAILPAVPPSAVPVPAIPAVVPSGPVDEDKPIGVLPAVVLPEHHHPLLEAEADFLLWKVRRGNVPVLVTTSTAPSTAVPPPGTLGQNQTTILFGGSTLPFDEQVGLRAAFTLYPVADGPVGLQLGGFFLGRSTVNYSVASNAQGSPILAQPLTTPDLGPNALPIAIPNFGPDPGFRGDISEQVTSNLFGYEINAVHHYRKIDGYPQMHSLGGFRALGLQESLVQTTNITNLANPLNNNLPLNGVPVRSVRIIDSFRASTNFYGGQFGVRACWIFSAVSVDVWGKLALGVSQQHVIRSGESIGSNGDRVAAGVRVVSSNAGTDTWNRFAVLPEVGLNLGYAVTDNIRLRLGYTFLYLSSAARVGEQIDTTVDRRLVPTTNAYNAPGAVARPAVLRNSTDFWAQGGNLGLEITF